MKKTETKNNINKSILSIIYIFAGLFFLIMGYFTYFMVVRSGDVINSNYNKRQNILTQKIVRGNIISADGEILAQTKVDKNGAETREYPFGPVFAHVVGRYSKGLAGLEESENIRLLTSSINSIEKMYHDLADEKSLGNNVITTLDSKLQQIAYDALGDYRGSVVVMEPSTGKILAMVSKPAYDPNKIDILWESLIEDKEGKSPLVNRATQGLYTPGSTFKLLTSLEYMREHPDYLSYQYNCKGTIDYEGMVIHCYNNNVHGKVDLPTSLAKSCNTSFSSIGSQMDIAKFQSLCDSFLFNQNLPISLTNNASRFSLTTTSGVKEAMQTAIGQGQTLITPLHNAVIVSTIANKGVMMKPYVVDRIENAFGSKVKQYSPQKNSKPMTQQEAIYLGHMMREVVTDGTATKLKDLKVEVAGKTGSAEQTGKKAHSWFVGYAPYDDPEIAVSIIVENVGTGSEYAVPIAKKIFDAYFR